MARAHIGCSGFSYKHWRGTFYPEKHPARLWFEFYAERFDTVEINASFYRLPTDAAVSSWVRRQPAGFIWTWKAWRMITHMRRLLNCQENLELMFGRMDPLGREGPVLFQLPPSMQRDDERLKSFIALLPKGRRISFEFRHPSWYDEAVFRLLEETGCSLCISDHHHAPAPFVATAEHVYLRGHGPGGRYHGRYDDATLKAWAGHVRRWKAEGREVFVYFDNDIGTAAPVDASRLIELVHN